VPDSTISNSYVADGDVDSESDAGGFIGELNNGTVTSSSYWDSDTITVIEGGEDQGNQSDAGTDLSTTEMTGLNATENMEGFVFPNSEGTWHVTSSYPALEWQDTESFYAVTIEDTNSPVDEGDTLEVTTSVRTLAADGTQTVELRDTDFDDDQWDTDEISLTSGESTETVFEWSTATGDAGTGLVSVHSDNETDSQEVTIEEVSTSGGGGGGSSSGSDTTTPSEDDSDGSYEPEQADETVGDTRTTVDESEPDIDIDRTIEDSDPESSGTTIDTSDEAGFVESVTITDEETTGSVSVREHSTERVVDWVSSSLSVQLDDDVRSYGTVADITVSDEAGESTAETAARSDLEGTQTISKSLTTSLSTTRPTTARNNSRPLSMKSQTIEYGLAPRLRASRCSPSLNSTNKKEADDGAEETDDTIPGFGAVVTLVALITVLALAKRRTL